MVSLEKKVAGEWPRLLSSLVKLRFIKSEYNNLKSSDDESGDGANAGPDKKRKKSKYI